jgi:hypothetical protein
MENNKQQTPVEWLIEQFYNNVGMLTSKKLLKAKEMEKKRMIEFAQSYAVIHCMGDITKNAEDYYSETYGDDKK